MIKHVLTATAALKPPLRWAGSKRKLIPELLPLIPATFNRYIEPFCGSACLFFALKPKKSILGDFNPELINFYRVLSKSPSTLYNAVCGISRSEEEYYSMRSLELRNSAIHLRAVRFYFLNRLCFNGVFRTNSHGKFNVPFGRNTGEFPSREEFIGAANQIKEAELRCADYKDVISAAKAGDIVYLDPPYATFGVRNRGEYGAGTFSELDIPCILSILSSLDKMNVSFLMSYSLTNSVIDFACEKRWRLIEIKVQRHVAGFAGDRKKTPELLISNY